MLTRWTILSPWQGTAVEISFCSLDALWKCQGEEVSRDKQSTVIKTSVDGRNFYVKRYHRTTGLRSWFGRSRIRLEAKNQLWFNHIGLPSAKVVAYGEKSFLGKTLRGGLITEEEVNTRDLAWLAQHRPERFNDPVWIKSISRQLAAITSVLHAHRFAHNDLKWRNILVKAEGDPQLFLIDCPTGQRWPAFLLKRRIIKDIACLDKLGKYHLSRTQRLRFFLLYRKKKRLEESDKKMIVKILNFFEGRE